MSETIDRRSWALYKGDMHRRELCDRVACLERDLERARDLLARAYQRMRWADETCDGGVLDARMVRDMRDMGVEERK